MGFAISRHLYQNLLRYPFAVLDKSVESRWQRHQRRLLSFPGIGNSAGQLPVLRLGPKGDAAIFQPLVQFIQILEDWHDLPKAVARILNVLLDLTFLPARRWVAKLRLKNIVTCHRFEPRVDVALFATANAIDSSLRVHCPRTNGGQFPLS